MHGVALQKTMSLLALLAMTTPVSAKVPQTLISSTPLAGAPSGSSAYRIRYYTTDLKGRRHEVTGAVIVPNGPSPVRGRDVVAWAHGTSGVAESCAPSDSPNLYRSIAGLPDMIKRGYVVVAADYEGLGSVGPHPFLVGESAARTVIDAVRATRQLRTTATTGRYAVWGESQGGQTALATGQIAGRYAPDLQLVAIAAAAPPTDLKANLTGGKNGPVRSLLTAYTAKSWSQYYGVPMSTVVKPLGADLIHRLAKNCVSLDGVALRTQIGLARLTLQLRGVDFSKQPRWASLLKSNSIRPIASATPLLIAQGTADAVVAPSVTNAFVKAICSNGQRVRYVAIDKGDHFSIGAKSAAATIDWLSAMFAGVDQPNDCAAIAG